MMDHQFIEEHDLVERYLADRLSAEEQSSFEAHFVDCPQCQDQLESAEEFRAALRLTAAQAADRALFSGDVPSPPPYWNGPRLAIAAGIALALLALPVAWYLWSIQPALLEAQRTAAELRAVAQPQANTPNVLLSLTRSAGPGDQAPARQIVLDPDTYWLTLSLEVEPDADITSYSAALLTADGSEIWQRSGLRTNIHDVVALTFPSAFLEPGQFQIRLRARTGQETDMSVGTYRFEISTTGRDR